MTSAERLDILDAQLRELSGELAEALRRLAGFQADLQQLRTTIEGSGPRFAEIYAEFIDHFRGTPEDVTAKLAVYLPDVRRLIDATAGGVVDVGSGRGEWLTLLRDAGIPARGVDANQVFVDAARGRGLDVIHGDAVTHLRSLPVDSVDLVTAFHLIEHLAVEEFLALLAAARHALRPGGCVLLETPNPTNLRMAACDFYNDPTHRSPLPPALTEFLVSAAGFADIEVRPMNPGKPAAEPADAGGYQRVEQLVVDVLYGPQDYAVLGYKPQLTD